MKIGSALRAERVSRIPGIGNVGDKFIGNGVRSCI